MKHVDDYRLEPEEPQEFALCDCCYEPIYIGDYFYNIPLDSSTDMFVCSECISDFKACAGE